MALDLYPKTVTRNNQMFKKRKLLRTKNILNEDDKTIIELGFRMT